MQGREAALLGTKAPMSASVTDPLGRHLLSGRNAQDGRMRSPLRVPSAVDAFSFFVAALCCVFVWSNLHPDLILADTTPTGGDMGAHVWGPAYLRDVLLPQGRLTGWTPDWYAGFPAYQFYMLPPALLIVALDMVLPYGVAFKLVAVSGVVLMPAAAWAFARLSRLPAAASVVFPAAAVMFVFDRSFMIYGGNAASTLAGEFSYAISLSLSLLAGGFAVRYARWGGSSGTFVASTVLLALAVLSHPIPAVFVAALYVGAWAVSGFRRGALRRLVCVGVPGVMMTAWWTLPFVGRSGYMNDMGWEKLTTYWELLLPGRAGEQLSRVLGGAGAADVSGDLTLVAALAVAGAVMAVARRRPGVMVLVVAAGLVAAAFVLAPQGRLWNARLLPFWYLSLYMLAAYAAAEGVTFAVRVFRGGRTAQVSAAAAVAVTVLVGVGMPLRSLPGGQVTASGDYEWMGLRTSGESFVGSWAEGNFSGYERQDAWPEYSAVVEEMRSVADEHGCGTALWEYEQEKIGKYGTPMAMMLLPYWTDGCVGSSEGLFFESSGTTPYHFLAQSALSKEPSRAQRDLPYPDLDVDEGVEIMRQLGVRYYMAFSAPAVSQANAHPDLVRVGGTGDWQVYLVEGSGLVAPVEHKPVVVGGSGKEWTRKAVDWLVDPDARSVLIASDGPDSWPRTWTEQRTAEVMPEVSGVKVDNDEIRFSVSRPGVPVLVRASYFPNWRAIGADGPWRVSPNMMVVVPTDEEVVLRYAWTPLDIAGWTVTLAGFAAVALVVAARRRR